MALPPIFFTPPILPVAVAATPSVITAGQVASITFGAHVDSFRNYQSQAGNGVSTLASFFGRDRDSSNALLLAAAAASAGVAFVVLRKAAS